MSVPFLFRELRNPSAAPLTKRTPVSTFTFCLAIEKKLKCHIIS